LTVTQYAGSLNGVSQPTD